MTASVRRISGSPIPTTSTLHTRDRSHLSHRSISVHPPTGGGGARSGSGGVMSATTAAVPFWRAAGMTYIGYSNICAALVRNCLKEPFKSEAASREKVHFSVSKWADGKQEKPSECLILPDPPSPLPEFLARWIRSV
jgi:F-type H+-transporting ATPase subunit epsilon